MSFNRFVTGFVIGNIVGMAGAALTSRNTKKDFSRTSKEWMVKIGNIVDGIADMYK